MPKKKTQEKVKNKELTLEEYEKKVKELASTGLTAEKIGEKLRKEGIHPKNYSKKISKILGDKYVNPDLKNIEEKLNRIEKHIQKNKQDKRAKREKDRVFAQLSHAKKILQ